MSATAFEKSEKKVVEIKISIRDICRNTLISLGESYFADIKTSEHAPQAKPGDFFTQLRFLKTNRDNKKTASALIREFFKEGLSAISLGDVMDEIEYMVENDIQFQLCVTDVIIHGPEIIEVVVPCSDILI